MRRTLICLLMAGFLAAAAALPAAAAPEGDEPSAPPPATTTAAAPEGGPVYLSGITQVSAGYDVTCGRTSTGRVRCWGANDEGQLGQGDTNPRPFAVTVRNASNTGPLVNVVQVATQDDGACALLTNREVRCWGDNDYGELGDGDAPNDSSLPVPVLAVGGSGRLDTVRELSAESDGMCALLANSQARCWGADDYGQLGDGGGEADSDTPVIVRNVANTGPLTGVAEIEAGYDGSCARLANGQVRCWGENTGGEVGDGTTTQRDRPVAVRAVSGPGVLTGVTELTHGGGVGCAELNTGQARCWGENDDGEVGDGTTTQRNRPVPVRAVTGAGNLTGVVSITGGYNHACALLGTGQARCWGDTDDGEVGDGTPVDGTTDRLRPRIVKNLAGTGPLTGVRSIHANQAHTCVVLAQGRVQCWGYNDGGQLGNGGTTDRSLPVRVRIA